MQRKLSFRITSEDGIASGSSTSSRIRRASIKLVAFGAEPVFQSLSGLGVLTVLLHDGNVWVTTEEGNFLSVKVCDVDDVNRSDVVVSGEWRRPESGGLVVFNVDRQCGADSWKGAWCGVVSGWSVGR